MAAARKPCYHGCMPLDDTALRAAAAALLAAAIRDVPRVAWGLHAVELGTAKIIVEIEVGRDGPSGTALVLDSSPSSTAMARELPATLRVAGLGL